MYEQFEGGLMANRFRSGADWFVRSRIGAVHAIRIGTSGERAVELLHALASELPTSIHLSIEAVREKKAWLGTDVSRDETRDTLARLKLLLSTYGGVEFALFTREDQLTLTSEMELVIYARTGRWTRRLISLGLEEREAMPAATWRPTRHTMSEAPELSEAIATVVQRLSLSAVDNDIVGPTAPANE